MISATRGYGIVLVNGWTCEIVAHIFRDDSMFVLFSSTNTVLSSMIFIIICCILYKWTKNKLDYNYI